MLRKILLLVAAAPLSVGLIMLLLVGLEWPRWIAYSLGMTPVLFAATAFGQTSKPASSSDERRPKRRNE